jgi:hypothetical protein
VATFLVVLFIQVKIMEAFSAKISFRFLQKICNGFKKCKNVRKWWYRIFGLTLFVALLLYIDGKEFDTVSQTNFAADPRSPTYLPLSVIFSGGGGGG